MLNICLTGRVFEVFLWIDLQTLNPHFTMWDEYEDMTCYRLDFINNELGYANVEYYSERGFSHCILEFRDICIDDEIESLEDKVWSLVRRTHKELNPKEDLLSTKEAACEIVKLVLERKPSW